MRAVIMAGGRGTRLKSVAADIPKPMVPVLGKPILEYQIESLVKSGIKNITIIVGHLKEAIKGYFGNGRKFGVRIDYIEETEPLGTAGALYYLKDDKEDFILVFGDLILDIDFNRFMDFHRAHDAAITLYGHANAHPYDSDVIVAGKDGKVLEILGKKAERDFYYHNFVNAGIYCVNPVVHAGITVPVKTDLERTVITGLIGQGKVYAYKSTEYVKDMGTPDRLKAVSADVRNGVVAGRSLKQKQKAIFLGRDGIINEYAGVLRRIGGFKLLPLVPEAIKSVNESHYLAILASNQPVMTRGGGTDQEIEEIQKKMETELGKKGAYFDDILFCPHYLRKSHKGEEVGRQMDCERRKTEIGLLKYAAEKYNIDLSASWYISGITRDIQTGKNAGMKTILIRTGKDGKYEAFHDYLKTDLYDAVRHIIGEPDGCG